MCLYKPDGTKFKHVCTDFPNLSLLTKSATPGDIQVNFGHAFVGNKSLGGTVYSFALTGSMESPMVVSIDVKSAFARASEENCLPVMEVLISAAVRNLAHSKNLRDWALLNAVLLLSFITDVVVLDGKTSAPELLNIFAVKIVKR